MRLCLAVMLLSAPVAAADEPKVATTDREALQGLWQATAAEANGEVLPAEAWKAFQLLIKGDKVVFSPDRDNRESTFALTPDAKPKAMDLTPSDGPAKGMKLPCAIYKLEGDKLTICFDKEGQAGKRPTEFKTTAGDGLALIILERVKEKK
jgi:uncharacterized protein (TIGR03067 family)